METMFDYKNTTLYVNLKTYLIDNTHIRPDVHAHVAEPMFVRSSRIPDDTVPNAMIHAYLVTVLHDDDGSATRSVESLTVWIDDEWDVLSCERVAMHFV